MVVKSFAESNCSGRKLFLLLQPQLCSSEMTPERKISESFLRWFSSRFFIGFFCLSWMPDEFRNVFVFPMFSVNSFQCIEPCSIWQWSFWRKEKNSSFMPFYTLSHYRLNFNQLTWGVYEFPFLCNWMTVRLSSTTNILMPLWRNISIITNT